MIQSLWLINKSGGEAYQDKMDASLYETIPLGLLDRNHSKAYYYNSLHYGSDTGAEMAVTYHSVIGMIKFHSSSIWNFIGTFFKNIFNGYKDYVNVVPDKITLAASQC